MTAECGVKCKKESRCIPDFGLIITIFSGQKNRDDSGLMAAMYGGHIIPASGGLTMAGSGGLLTVESFGLMMVIYMAHHERYLG